MPIHKYTTEINTLVFDDVVQDPIASFTISNKNSELKIKIELQPDMEEIANGFSCQERQ